MWWVPSLPGGREVTTCCEIAGCTKAISPAHSNITITIDTGRAIFEWLIKIAENLWDTQNKMLTSFLLCALAMATLVGAKTTHQECKAKQSKPTVSGSTDGR